MKLPPELMFVTVWITRAPGFFGPVIHAYPQCSDEDTTPIEDFIPLTVHDDHMALISEDWLCGKCGDTLTEWYRDGE